MATKRPAKLAIGKKDAGKSRIDAATGKPMTPVKVLRRSGSSGMHWVLLDEFDGSPKALDKMQPIR